MEIYINLYELIISIIRNKTFISNNIIKRINSSGYNVDTEIAKSIINEWSKLNYYCKDIFVDRFVNLLSCNKNVDEDNIRVKVNSWLKEQDTPNIDGYNYDQKLFESFTNANKIVNTYIAPYFSMYLYCNCCRITNSGFTDRIVKEAIAYYNELGKKIDYNPRLCDTLLYQKYVLYFIVFNSTLYTRFPERNYLIYCSIYEEEYIQLLSTFVVNEIIRHASNKVLIHRNSILYKRRIDLLVDNYDVIINSLITAGISSELIATVATKYNAKPESNNNYYINNLLFFYIQLVIKESQTDSIEISLDNWDLRTASIVEVLWPIELNKIDSISFKGAQISYYTFLNSSNKTIEDFNLKGDSLTLNVSDTERYSIVVSLQTNNINIINDMNSQLSCFQDNQYFLEQQSFFIKSNALINYNNNEPIEMVYNSVTVAITKHLLYYGDKINYLYYVPNNNQDIVVLTGYEKGMIRKWKYCQNEWLLQWQIIAAQYDIVGIFMYCNSIYSISNENYLIKQWDYDRGSFINSIDLSNKNVIEEIIINLSSSENGLGCKDNEIKAIFEETQFDKITDEHKKRITDSFFKDS